MESEESLLTLTTITNVWPYYQMLSVYNTKSCASHFESDSSIYACAFTFINILSTSQAFRHKTDHKIAMVTA